MSDLPIRVMFEKLGQVTRGDAEIYCKGKIERYFDNPIESFFFIKKVDDEWFCEIHEGGSGRAFLPDLIKILQDDNQPDEVLIPSGTRAIKASMEEDEGIIFYMLNDGDFPDLNIPKRTSRMTPFQGDSRGFLVVSISCLLMSLIVLVTSFTARETVREYQGMNNAVDQFITFHRMMNQMERLPENRYINKIEFNQGRWTIDINQREVIEDEVDAEIEKTQGDSDDEIQEDV